MPESPEQTESQQLYWDELSDIGPDSFDALAESAAPFPALSLVPENAATPAGGAFEEDCIEEEEVENLTATEPENPATAVFTPKRSTTGPITRTDSTATTVTVTAPTPPFSRVLFPSRSTLGTGSDVFTASIAGPSSKKRDASSLSPTEIISPSKRVRVERNPFAIPAGPSATSTTSRPAASSSSGYFIVAHSKHHQPAIDKRELAWGTQWEIGRLITKRQVSWDSLTFESLDRLKGSNSEAAPRVYKLLRKSAAPEPVDGAPTPQLVVPDELRERYYAVEKAKTDPFGELDAEETLLANDDPRRLGITPLQSDHYFSGRVVQTISVGPSVKEPTWSIRKVRDKLQQLPLRERYDAVMEPQGQGRSTRFTRWYGSRRIIAVKVHKLLLSDGRDLVEFLSLGFVIFAFLAKKKGVYLVETDENYERYPSSSAIDTGRLSFMDFIDSHNPLAQNSGQAMAKWAARFQIAMSTSVPWVKFDRVHIYDEPDVISAKCDLAKGKPPAEYTMTDGCGFMNGAAARLLANRFDLQFAPSAVQARLGGAKGMFLIKPGEDGSDDPPKAWCRPSQLKVTWPDNPNDSQLMFDVVRLPRVTCPTKAGAETLMNLAHNGVPHSVFQDLMRTGLEEEVRALTTWDEGNSASNAALWLAVCKAGGMIAERMCRETSGTARARGYVGDDDMDDSDDDDDEEEDAMGQTRSARCWPDEISGSPSTLHEKVCSLLTAGFTPSTNHVLFTILDSVMRMAVKAYVKRYKIGIPSSLRAFIVPDPLNVLKEGEVFFRSSRPILNPATGKELDVLQGDVLVGRYPTKLPTDIQKMRAVDVPELRMYRDVVIFSVQGEKSAASYLGGGDYDGDIVTVIWEPSIVGPFVNAPLHLADPPPNLNNEFSRENESVPNFLSRVRDSTPVEAVRAVQRVMLDTLIDNSVVGQYSNWHEIAIYKLGLDHPDTRRLAHLFCNQLDGAKSGLRIKPEVRNRDAAAWNSYEDLAWKDTDVGMQGPAVDSSGNNRRAVIRPKILGRFIMDDLQSVGMEEAAKHFARYREREPQVWREDQDLLAPYKDAEARAKILMDKNNISLMQDELKVLVREVSDVHEEHRKAIGGKGAYATPQKKKASVFGRSTSFSDLSIQSRQDTLRRLSALFASSKYEYRFFSSDEVKRIKASYAYKLAPMCNDLC